MSSGGKGGETETKIDPEVKAVMMDMAKRGKAISQLPKLNYQGLTMAAPSAATENYANQRNAQANLLGVGMQGSPLAGLPEAKEINGMKGYAAHDLYKDELGRQFKNNPQALQKYNQIVPGQFQNPNTANPNQMPNQPGSMLPPWLNYDALAEMWRNGGWGR